MKRISLNGEWLYRIGNGKLSPITVPFSRLPVGRSECLRSFDLSEQAERLFLKFDGITYHARVFLNGKELGEMGPYCEYEFEITDLARPENNELKVVLEDIDRAFGPTAGWENFGGIIRDVSLLYADKNRIRDITFKTELINDYQQGKFWVETASDQGNGSFELRLYDRDCVVASYTQHEKDGAVVQTLENVRLWSPDAPALYRLEVTLRKDQAILDTQICMVGFREFRCDRHRFYLNGEPLFLKGVCKHEMVGDSGHCPSEEQIRRDLKAIKEIGCNFVRLVHYPHHKKTLEIADQLGLMVSEEPGLWWSNTADPQVSAGSLEVLRRTIQRDKNHPAIVFWLCFNECRFTEQFLIDSAKLCRKCDPTRLVSGANCMSNEDTLKYYNLCGFDFYTMHPYAPTPDRAMESAQMLHDKPLLFTEWGGYHVYNNPHLLQDFIEKFHQLYLQNSDEGALAGAFFWEWSEVNDYNRGRPACIDGNLSEGLVDKYRKPTLIYSAFCEALAAMDAPPQSNYWAELAIPDCERFIPLIEAPERFNKLVGKIHAEQQEQKKQRKIQRARRLPHGPALQNVKGLCSVPLVLTEPLSVDCELRTDRLSLWGMTSLLKGYPLGGEYGEKVAEMIITYDDNEQETVLFRNGEDITTVFALNNSSRIDPIAENAKRITTFGYDKNFEYYVFNQIEIHVNADKLIKTISVCPENNGYAVLIYGIGYSPLD